MKFEQTFKVGIREIGMKNEVTNYGFLSYLEDIATAHSDTIGYGVKDIPVRKGAWLLMDWELEVKNRPPFNSNLKVYTCAISQDKPSFHCYRNFEIYDESNNLVATATSRWIFFNIETHKITKLDKETMDLFNTEGNPDEAESKLKKLKEPTSYEKVFEYEVKRADIDVNKHVNNLNYLKLAYEILPDDIYFGDEPKNLRISYKRQIMLGAKIKCFYSFEDNKHCITIKSADEKIIHSIIELW